MLRMMYFMNVPWSWIKQRPHFLAEELSQYYNVDVFFKKTYCSDDKVDNTTNSKLVEILRLPYERVPVISKINDWLTIIQLRKVIKQYDIIWLSSPHIYSLVKNSITHKQKIVYDCMDNLMEFPHIKQSPLKSILLKEEEEELVHNCNCIFASSEHLKNSLIQRCPNLIVDKVFILNNAISSNTTLLTTTVDQSKKDTEKYKIITYIGTISEWFDFDIILKSLEDNQKVIYNLYGPKSVVIPNHERIVYLGLLEHNNIFEVMKKSDLLIMPFKVNELVLSVNPVKLYEYIFSSRPILAVRYGETEKFMDYVYLYNDYEEYSGILAKLSNNELYPPNSFEKNIDFAKNNTWNIRAKLVVGILEALH